MDATSADQTPEIVMGHCNCFKTIQLNKKRRARTGNVSSFSPSVEPTADHDLRLLLLFLLFLLFFFIIISFVYFIKGIFFSLFFSVFQFIGVVPLPVAGET